MSTLQNVGPLIGQNVSVEKGATYWLTGLSGCGKSTIAEALKKHLDAATGNAQRVTCLDGDVIRQGLNKGLGFSVEDRAENIRRIGEVAKLLNAAGQIVFCSFISPEAGPRARARETHEANNQHFVEVYVNTPIETCEERDPKGLYKKARAGIIPNFTGVSADYEEPKDALNIDTSKYDLEQCMRILQQDMLNAGVIKDNNNRPVVASLVQDDAALRAAANNYPKLEIDQMQAEFVQTIGEGWANPLKRFMNEMELLECMNKKTLTTEDGQVHLMSVPITQHLTKDQREAFGDAKNITLTYQGKNIAIINEPEYFDNRKEEICTRTFGCFETSHPYAARIMEQGEFLVSGASMNFIEKVMWNDGMDSYRMTPAEISAKAKSMNADAVFAFQVRNPLHNGHCLLLKQTREDLIAKGYKNPILLLHPLGGWCKDDDVPLGPRIAQHQALIDDGTLNKDHIILAVWPSPMFYGGPTEVLWHCSSRVGAGITHFITGRDPAGVGHPTIKGQPLYDVWHGQKLLKHCQNFLNGVEVLPFKLAALNTTTHKMEFFNPKAANQWKFVSGSEMRKLGAEGAEQPEGFMSNAGWKVLQAYYQEEAKKNAPAPVAPQVEAKKEEPAPQKAAEPATPAATETKQTEAPKAETKAEEPAAEGSSTNWAAIGLGVAVIAGGVWAYLKHVKN